MWDGGGEGIFNSLSPYMAKLLSQNTFPQASIHFRQHSLTLYYIKMRQLSSIPSAFLSSTLYLLSATFCKVNMDEIVHIFYIISVNFSLPYS